MKGSSLIGALAILLVATTVYGQAPRNDSYSQEVRRAIAEGLEPYTDPGTYPIVLSSELKRAFPRLAAKGNQNLVLTTLEFRELYGHPAEDGKGWVAEHDDATEKGLMPISERLWTRVKQYTCNNLSSYADRKSIADAMAEGHTNLVYGIRRTDTVMFSGSRGTGSVSSKPVQTIGFSMTAVQIQTPVQTCEGLKVFPTFVVFFEFDDSHTQEPCINLFGMRADTTTAIPSPAPSTTAATATTAAATEKMDLHAADKPQAVALAVALNTGSDHKGGWCNNAVKFLGCAAAIVAVVYGISKLNGPKAEATAIAEVNLVTPPIEAPSASPPTGKIGSPPARPILAFRF
jgi:hypothetical protein